MDKKILAELSAQFMEAKVGYEVARNRLIAEMKVADIKTLKMKDGTVLLFVSAQTVEGLRVRRPVETIDATEE